MSERKLILTLAKVIIAAAWADGEITRAEINTLTDLLSRLPYAGLKRGLQITGREWAMLKMYMDAPVSGDELARLVEELKTALHRPGDRTLAIAVLENLVQADGVVTDEERAAVEEIKSSLEAVDFGIFGQLGRLIRGPIQRHSQVLADAPNRERHLGDFISNRVYYKVRQRISPDETDREIPEAELRKLCLVGGLMALVAYVDQEVTENERDAIANALQAGRDITQEMAATIAEVAITEASAGLDEYRTASEYFASTAEQERVRLLDALFGVANADGQVSLEEHEEIRRIATILKLTQQQFIQAKLKTLQE